MPKFSQMSEAKLSEAHPVLQKIFREIIKYYDFSVREGKRTVERQKLLVAAGASKTMNSRHIPRPGEGYCRAVDVCPFPQDKGTLRQFYYLAGMVKAIAERDGVRIRWGGDWDQDTDFKDNSFNDLYHFEYND